LPAFEESDTSLRATSKADPFRSRLRCFVFFGFVNDKLMMEKIAPRRLDALLSLSFFRMGS
jgi:hypothetical protein